jgi:hypothetical protein
MNPRPAVWHAGPSGANQQRHRLVAPREGNRVRREGRRRSEHLVIPLNPWNRTRGTRGRERSEANCHACGCKSRRCKSPCGTVAISGSLRFTGDWKPGRKSPRRPGGHRTVSVGSVQGANEQEGRSQSERTNRRNRVPHETDSSGVLECQDFLPSRQWPVSVRKAWGDARTGLPAEVDGGNLVQFDSESSEGLEPRQDGPGMPKTGSITSYAGKWAGGDQTGG